MSNFNFEFFSRRDYKSDRGPEITVDQYFDANEWEFCYGGSYVDDFNPKKKLIQFSFHPKAMPHYDRCLPFTFGGESDEPYETVITIPAELKDEFENYAISCRFTLVDPWWEN